MSQDREAGGAGATTAPDGAGDVAVTPDGAPGAEEAFFRRLVESSLDVFYVADADGVLTYISPQVARYGWTPEQLVGRNLLEFVAAEDRKRVAGELANPSAPGTARATPFRVRSAAGRIHWLEEVGPVHRDADGRVTGFTGVLRDITERKAAAEREQAVLERLRLLEVSVNQSPVVIFRWRIKPEEWPVEVVTDNVRQFGYEPEDFFSGRVSWPGITHPGDVPRLEQEVAGFMAEGRREFGQHYRLFTASGEVRWIEDRNTVITDAAGTPTHIQGIVLDVTGRRQAEEALRHNEARYEQMTAYIEDVLYGVDGRTGEFQYASPAFTRLLGYTLADVARMGGREKFLAAVILDGRFAEQQAIFRSIKPADVKDDPVQWSAWWRCKDGTVKFIEDRWIPVFSDGGLQSTYGVLRDSTARKQADEALRESEEQFRAIFESASIGMAQAHVETGQWLRVNKRMCEITGYSEEEMLRMQVSMVTHPEDRQRDWELFRRVVDGEQPAYQLEKRYLRKDGSIAWVNVNMTVIRDGGGRPLRTVATIEDISARRQIEEAVAESNRQFRFLYDNMREGVVHCRMIYQGRKPVDYEILAVNPAYERITGLPGVVGRKVSELIPDYARDNADSLKIFGTVARTGRSARWEHRLAALGRWFSFSIYSPARGEFIAVFDDVTDRKTAEERIAKLTRAEALISGVNHAIAHLTDRQTFLDQICRVAVRRGGFKLAWIGMAQPDGTVKAVARRGLKDYVEGLRVVVSPCDPHGRGPMGTAIRENRPVVVADIESDPDMAPWCERARRFHLRYVAAVPLEVDGRVVGGFCAYAPVPGFFDADEIRLLAQMGGDVSFALTALEHEEERRKAEERLRLEDAALAAAANGVAIIDREGTIVWVNASFATMTGYTLEEVRGRNPRVLKSGLHDENFYRNMWSTILAGRVWGGQLINRRKDGSHYNEEMTITPVRSGRGRITHFIAIKQDITQRKRLESEMAAAVEREQERIGNDLHDGLCQILTGAKFRTALLGQKLRGWAPVAETGDAKAIEALLDQAIEQARGISYGLNPVRDAPAGLMEALEQLAAGADNGTTPRCVCRIPEAVPIHDRAVAVQLFRIAQEAVQNALRHARARTIAIELTRRDDAVHLTIADDGAGLPQPDRLNRGMGLMNMQRRAGLIGATLELRRGPRRGTQVICHLRRPAFAKEDRT